jgi:RimJ/RimL family protein N-acetyltransferase
MSATIPPLVTSLHIAPVVPANPVLHIGTELRYIELATGEIIPWRTILPTDTAALQDFHEHLSDTSIRMRFFNYMPHLSDAMAHRFTHLDSHNRLALIALDPANPASIIAVTRLDRTPGSREAEYAAIVTDRWQGRGLGIQLSRQLITRARDLGIDTLTAEVLPENAKMLHLFRDLGYPVSIVYEDGVAMIRIDLTTLSEGAT